MPKNGAYVIHELHTILGLTQVNVSCRKCPRRGRVSVGRLIRTYGPNHPLPGLAVELATGCTRRASADIYNCCGANFPGIGHALNAATYSRHKA